jgi:hypothetical protein
MVQKNIKRKLHYKKQKMGKDKSGRDFDNEKSHKAK